MNDITPAQTRLDDPLRPTARRERRALVGLSFLSIFMMVTQSIPREITLFGNTFLEDVGTVLWGLTFLVLYFLIVFVFYSATDLKSWRLRLLESEKFIEGLDREIVDKEEKLSRCREQLSNQIGWKRRYEEEFRQQAGSGDAHAIDFYLKQIIPAGNKIAELETAIKDLPEAIIRLRVIREIEEKGRTQKFPYWREVVDFNFPVALGELALICLVCPSNFCPINLLS